jgi:hypothetical protein
MRSPPNRKLNQKVLHRSVEPTTYSVEKLVWQSGAGTASKFDLIEWPLLNATRSGDGL